MLWKQGNFVIDTDRSRLDVNYIHQFLMGSYWAKNIPIETVRKAINGSICFSVFHVQKQVGFGRVITDEATFAYLADVFIDEEFRGQGLSKWLMQCILSYPGLQGLRRFLLATRDAHGLYEKMGFKKIEDIAPWMHMHNPGVYS